MINRYLWQIISVWSIISSSQVVLVLVRRCQGRRFLIRTKPDDKTEIDCDKHRCQCGPVQPVVVGSDAFMIVPMA